MDAGTRQSCFEQRWPSLVPHCPKLGPGSVAGAALLSFSPEEPVRHTSGHHHTLAFSPAGPCPPGLQNQGQVTSCDSWARGIFTNMCYLDINRKIRFKDSGIFWHWIKMTTLVIHLDQWVYLLVCFLFLHGFNSHCQVSMNQCVPLQVVYVSRNPRDVAVSFFHFHKMAAFLPECGTFAEFLDQFLEGAGELSQTWMCSSEMVQKALPSLDCCLFQCATVPGSTTSRTGPVGRTRRAICFRSRMRRCRG